MKTKIAIFLTLFVILNSSFLIINCYSQWESEVRLTDAPDTSFFCSVSVNESIIHVVWVDKRDDNWEIYYKRSTDCGMNWGADTRLTNNTAWSFSPTIAVSCLLVHVVWEDNRDGNFEIYYKNSTDGGITWGTDTRLTNNTAWSRFPTIAVSDSFVHVVWIDERDGNDEIYYKKSTNGGINWGADTRLTNNTAWSFSPTIAVSGSLVHVVWSDIRDGNSEIYYKKSTDGGINWGKDMRLTNGNNSSGGPTIAVSDTILHLVWEDWRNGKYNNEIYYKRSTDGGINWEDDVRLTNNNANSGRSTIAVSGNLLHLVWEDNRDGNPEIYYKNSTDGGMIWEEDTRLTNATNVSWRPSISVSGSSVYVVWNEGRDVNWEIYYKRNPTGNIEAISNENNNKDVTYSKALTEAQKAYDEGKYLLVIELLKDFPIDDAMYFKAVELLNLAISKIPNDSKQTFVSVSGRNNCGCSKAISGYVIFEDMSTGKVVNKCSITSDGYYCIVLPTGKRYSYYIESKDFYPVSRSVDFTSSNQSQNHKDDITIVTYEDMEKQQTSVRINNIFFDFNKSELKPESFPELDRLYKYLNENPAIKIEVSGHTDNVGSDEYNLTLSRARANSVKEYLVLKGISSSRIITQGFGESNPITTNDTEEGRQLNRRVEFKIIK